MGKLIMATVILMIMLVSLAYGEQRTLSWTDASNNELGFIIERKLGSAGAWNIVGHLAVSPISSFVDTGLSAGNTYFWRVRAYNSAGMSEPSNEVSTTIPGTVLPNLPLKPSTLTEMP